MRQEDYLLREIHKISELLLGLMGKLVKKKQETIIDTEKEFGDILASEVEKLSKFYDLSSEEIIQVYKDNSSLNSDNFELLGNLLFEMGIYAKEEDRNKAANYLQRAIAIYDYIDNEGDTFSFMRNSKKTEAEELLQHL